MRYRDSQLPLLPPAPPEPTPGCATCTDLAKRRQQAQAAGDYSRVSDCNVWISRHAYHKPSISG
ncbi:hypothetical protein [Streptomyces sp. ME18-1-4]|uniref:hypothetical protein n=1 Tax=Streptomyces sp. ME18-1-4 TaxID=3028685 RepID=UPI0029A5D08D|nr:hypothetical protein [Streptomyces sp. ME18-1-4]MDX3243686.1 hypothetical protein [Streptomyces sp. ME18-1-4]